MSILKVDELQSRTSGTRITLPEVNNYPPYRNLVINGDMRIAQRGTSFASANNYTLDRWIYQYDTSGAITITQDTDVPTGQGFDKSLKIAVTTSYTPTANQSAVLRQKIEGNNLVQLKKGTSSAESVTVSFWVKSNLTGTFIVEFHDIDNTRGISKSYTISSADTWEKKTITFDGDTSGALTYDNSEAMRLSFPISAGPGLQSGTLQTSWGTLTTANRFVGQTNVLSSTSNYINITGIQLEVGDSATPFEHLPYDVELARCERYFEMSYSQGTALGTTTDNGAEMWLANRDPGTPHHYLKFRTIKRANPSITIYNPSTGATGSFRNVDASTNPSSVISRIGHKGSTLYTTTSTSLGQFMQFHYTADSEL